MATKRPGVTAEEVEQLEGPIQAASVGFGALLMVTQKGPIGRAIGTRKFDEWKKIFGDRETRGDGAYEAKMFFDEGGVELVTVRVGHYTDIDDPLTFVGGVSTRTLLTSGVGATSASKLGAIGTFNLEPGQTVQLQVDGGGTLTATFTGVAAARVGGNVAIVSLTGDTLLVAIDGGAVQTITFIGSEADAEDIAGTINAQLVGGSATFSGSAVTIKSDRRGSGSSVQITGGTALVEINHTVGTTSGTGNASNIDAVTAAEIVTVFEAAFAGTTTIANGNGSFRITSDTSGASSQLNFIGGTALTALGLSVESILGTASGATYNTLKIEAGYHGTKSPGVAGDEVSVKALRNPRHPSVAAGSDIAANVLAAAQTVQVVSLSGLNQSSVVKFVDGSIVEYAEVEAVRSVVSGSNVTFFIDLVAPLVNPFTAASTTMQSMEFDLEVYESNVLKETWTDLSMLDTADNYVETIINDDAAGSVYIVVTDLDAVAGLGADTPAADSVKVALSGGSSEITGLVTADWIGSSLGGNGLYALDEIDEFMSIAAVGHNSAAFVHSLAEYCRNRVWQSGVVYVAPGLTKTQAKAYRETTLGLDSSYIFLYAGGVKVFDPNGAGSNPRRSIAGIGGIMGLMGRVDALPDPNGGAWQSPAGEGDYGKLRTALDVVTVYKDSEHGEMNEVGINVIRRFGGKGPVLVWGARTLDSSVQRRFRYINVRRFFQFVEKSVVDGTKDRVFRNNNETDMWGPIRDRVDNFLLGLLGRRAFPTSKKSEAYSIKVGITDGVMTQSDVDNGNTIGEIALAPNKPGEFITFRFTQFSSGSSAVEE